jgi:cation transport regulator
MPYQSNDDLPEDVQDALPQHAQEIYREAFNSAWDQYADQDDREATAHQVAWSAVKDKYKQNDDGEWVKEDK